MHEIDIGGSHSETGARAPAARVVVVGGGFEGSRSSATLAAPVSITLVDRQNFDLFQPLAYQVATGALSAAEIASRCGRSSGPGERARRARGGDGHRPGAPRGRPRRLAERRRRAASSRTTRSSSPAVALSYFGHPEWQAYAPELKSLDRRTRHPRRILTASRRPRSSRTTRCGRAGSRSSSSAAGRPGSRWPARSPSWPRTRWARIPLDRSERGARPARRGRRAHAPRLPRVALAQGDARRSSGSA